MRHLRVDRRFNPCCSAGGAAASTHQDHRAAGSWSQLVAHRTHLLNTMGAALQGRRAGVISPWPLQPFEFTSWHWQSLRTTPAAGSRFDHESNAGRQTAALPRRPGLRVDRSSSGLSQPLFTLFSGHPRSVFMMSDPRTCDSTSSIWRSPAISLVTASWQVADIGRMIRRAGRAGFSTV